MTALAAGAFRRTEIQRSDQRVAWERSDQAFFAAGACHVLAWTCQEFWAGRSLGIAAMRYEGEQRAVHTYATWRGWAFDHSGWNPEHELLIVNEQFERRRLERFDVTVCLAEFCRQHHLRTPDQFWRDPMPRARKFVGRACAQPVW